MTVSFRFEFFLMTIRMFLAALAPRLAFDLSPAWRAWKISDCGSVCETFDLPSRRSFPRHFLLVLCSF